MHKNIKINFIIIKIEIRNWWMVSEVEYKILLHVETQFILSLSLLSICLHIQYILFLFLKLLQVFVLCVQGILKLISI